MIIIVIDICDYNQWQFYPQKLGGQKILGVWKFQKPHLLDLREAPFFIIEIGSF